MIFFFDHLTATLVAIVLTAVLLSQQVQNRQAALERTSVYAAKGQALAFAEWVEDDVVKLGAQFGASRDRFSDSTEVIGGVPFTRQFTYYYNEKVTEGGIAERVEVRYDLAEDGGAHVVVEKGATPADDVALPLYTVTRSERRGQYDIEAGGWVSYEPSWAATPQYQSPHGLRHFRIEPQDSHGREAQTVEEADYVRVQFTVVPTLFPLYRARMVPREGLHWATTVEIRPF